MTVKININKNDLWNMNKYFILKRPLLRFLFIIEILIIPLAIINILKTSISYMIIGAVFGIIIDILVLLLMKALIMSLYANKKGVLGEHAIEISENGINESTSVNQGLHLWTGVYDVFESKHYIFIAIDKLQAHVIPKRSFNSDKEANEFYNKSIEYWKNSSSK